MSLLSKLAKTITKIDVSTAFLSGDVLYLPDYYLYDGETRITVNDRMDILRILSEMEPCNKACDICTGAVKRKIRMRMICHEVA